LLEKESVKGSEFIEELAKAEAQAARIENNKYLSSDKIVRLVREAATSLLAAIVEFLNAALTYFSGNVAGINMGFPFNDRSSQCSQITFEESGRALRNEKAKVGRCNKRV
jgi:hypothetical protein